MVEARLLVERGSIRDASQDWGVHAFLALPSPGDRVMVRREGEAHYLTVLCAHHRPVLVDGAADGEDAPAADVVAKWTGSE
ncbi:MAG TPA: hypothetical protein PKD99_01310 [Sphingopyxis sp.]|nr:hypothetical protein [Sphingopyxis sp.]HMP43713.1 hypothetical protein [Sphingopyxis sp.]HMQ17675.1 hypothetical protein [Sphingopyxis sp.]